MRRQWQRQSVFVLGVLLLLTTTATAAEWQPAKGPLATRWTKDVKADKAHPEYPRPQMVRKQWQNLNGLWQFAFAKKDEAAPIGKELSERILVPFPVESALSGVMKRADRLWYRRLFSVPADWKDQRILLHFGAVDWEAKVWLNGKAIGSHRGGYDAFTFDVTDALKKDGEQELIVGVWDPTDAGTQPRGKQINKPGGIMYTPTTGIWQTVWIEPVPSRGWIEALTIDTNLDRNEVTVAVQSGKKFDHPTFHVEVLDGDKKIAEAKGSHYSYTLAVPDAKLWTPETPHLYGLRVSASGKAAANGEDRIESYFGMRKISVGPDDKGITRLLLNNKPYFMAGPLDQGFWPDGLYTAPTDEALKYDIEVTKKLGFNMTRKHVKVEPARWYYWCDKLGLLVWQDMPSGDRGISDKDADLKRTPESANQYELELKRMIDGLRNHPSIIMWVVFNEGWGQFDTPRITEWTKKYDPSRLVDCASGWTDRGVGDVRDVHAYPGPASPGPEAKRAAVLGEFGGLGLKVDGHTWEKKTWGYRGASSRADLTRKYEKLLQDVYYLKAVRGLSAAVYTQLTDVETEANGLLTYDRAIIKVELDRVTAVNKGDFSRVPEHYAILPTAKDHWAFWRYVLEEPDKDWYKPDFNEESWKKGRGGFGTRGTPGSRIGTVWNTSDIWLRQTFNLPENAPKELHLLLHHDEDAEIYLNGVLAAKVEGYTVAYEEVAIDPRALATLKPGKNLLAVHCKQTGGGQYIDVGLGAYKKK